MSNQKPVLFALAALLGLGTVVLIARKAPDAESSSNAATKKEAEVAKAPAVVGQPVTRPATCKGPLSPEGLDRSIALGTAFLLSHQREAGNFDYEYNWQTKAYTDSDNQVRQAGATWGLALIYQDAPSPEVAAGLDKALAFFRENSRLTEKGERYVVYPGEPEGKLGTVALVALALIEQLRVTTPALADAKREMLEAELDQYLEFLWGARMPNGLFHGGYLFDTGARGGPPSQYADGEVLLALVKAAKYLGKDKRIAEIIELANRGYDIHYTQARKIHDDSPDTKGYYQWSSMAYFEIFTSTWPGREIFGERIVEAADWMIDVHHVLRRSKNTGYAFEGIVSAYEVARMRGDAAHAEKFACVIEDGLAKLTSWQVGHPLANEHVQKAELADALAVGGVQNSADEAPLRVDTTQHQMHAVILARRYYLKQRSL